MQVDNLREALQLPSDRFREKYGLDKPGPGQKLIFSCQAGVRARSATELAQSLGFANAACYPGSWADWSKNSSKSLD